MQAPEYHRFEKSCRDCLVPQPIVEDHFSGDPICTGCGQALGARVIDETSEWETFDNSEMGTGADPDHVDERLIALLSGGRLGTVFGKVGGGKAGIGAALSRAAARLDNPCVQFTLAIKGIARICDHLDLGSAVKGRACKLYKRLIVSRSMEGRKPQAVVAATVYIACKREQRVKTFEEVCGAISSADETEIGCAYEAIMRVSDFWTLLKPQGHIIHADQYIVPFCHSLGVSHDLQKAARQAIEVVTDPTRLYSQSPWYGKSHISIAAAVIYMLSLVGSPSDQRMPDRVARITGVAEVTLMASCRDLCTASEEIVPSWYSTPEKVKSLLKA